MSKLSPLLMADFYKMNHYQMYPEGTEVIYANFTPRKSRIPGVNHVVFFGLQYFILEYLTKKWNKQFFLKKRSKVLKEYTIMMDQTLGSGSVTADHIAQLYDHRKLPLLIRALPEGTLVPIGVPCFTIENTEPWAYWLVNYIETILSASIWQATTSATIAHQYRKILDSWAAKTSDIPEFVDWQGHDFSMRGMSSLESAQLSGAGHLLSFTGTDTIPAISFLQKYYWADGLVGASVPATEHSVMCAGGMEDEIGTFKRLLDRYPKGILSVVSDTWDLWKVLTEYLPQLKEQIMKREGKLVIRPDSGDPVEILCGDWKLNDRVYVHGETIPNRTPAEKGVIELLWEVFGGTVNSKGFKQLDPHIGCIYGDSITMDRAEEICKRLAAKGFASTNIVFGIGLT